MSKEDIKRKRKSRYGLATLREPHERFNPQMLRLIFEFLIVHEFDGNQKLAANSLQTSRLRKNPNTGAPVVPFSQSGISKVLKDNKPIDYSMLEAFAHQLGVPTWLLLLFSRVLSDHIDSNKAEGKISSEMRAEVDHNIARTKRFFENFQDLIHDGRVEMEHLPMWVDLYLNKPESQPSLFDEAKGRRRK